LGLEASRAVWKALLGVWSDGLPALVQRGLQLSLLLLERYMLWAREWSEYLDARLRGPPAEREAESAGGARRGDEELRVLGCLAGDCRVLAQCAGSELVLAVEAALLLVHRSEAAAGPSVLLVRNALAGAAGMPARVRVVKEAAFPQPGMRYAGPCEGAAGRAGLMGLGH
jgi:hypothetical protein